MPAAKRTIIRLLTVALTATLFLVTRMPAKPQTATNGPIMCVLSCASSP